MVGAVRGVLLACAIVAITARGARAEGIGVIATGDRATAAAMVAAIGGERGRVVDDAAAEARAAITAGAVPRSTLARFRAVRDEVAEGWRAYLQVSVEFAASRLASARTEAEALVALPGGAELYADASLRLGAVLAHLGRADESRAALRLALALDPTRPVTVAEFSPDVLDAVEAARATTPPQQRVRIASVGAGAMIEVDGKPVGRAPVELDVERGQHVIVARAPGYEPLAQAVAVDDSHSVFQLVLDPATDAQRLSAPPPTHDAAAYVEAVLTFAELDDVVVVNATERRGGPALVVQRCSGIPIACSAVVDIGYADAAGIPAAARAAWQAIRGGELRYPPSVFSAEGAGGHPTHRCEACRSPWLWVGVGAAALVTTAIIYAVTSGSRPPPVVGVDPGQF